MFTKKYCFNIQECLVSVIFLQTFSFTKLTSRHPSKYFVTYKNRLDACLVNVS